MNVWLISIGAKRHNGPTAELVADYIGRIERYLPCERKLLLQEQHLLQFVGDTRSRGNAKLVLMHGGGKARGSAEFAELLRSYRDSGVRNLMFAIGPADGWSAETLALSDETFSLGKITLPHELAAAVTAEQIYRGLTILAGHPYHTGH